MPATHRTRPYGLAHSYGVRYCPAWWRLDGFMLPDGSCHWSVDVDAADQVVWSTTASDMTVGAFAVPCGYGGLPDCNVAFRRPTPLPPPPTFPTPTTLPHNTMGCPACQEGGCGTSWFEVAVVWVAALAHNPAAHHQLVCCGALFYIAGLLRGLFAVISPPNCSAGNPMPYYYDVDSNIRPGP